VVVINKVDLLSSEEIKNIIKELEALNVKPETISAKENTGIEALKKSASFVRKYGCLAK
jgi:hypothetical protein